jgi:hypothetical protein
MTLTGFAVVCYRLRRFRRALRNADHNKARQAIGDGTLTWIDDVFFNQRFGSQGQVRSL